MVKRRLGWLCALAAMAIPAGVRAEDQSSCTHILPGETSDRARPVRPEDLVRLRDIGPVDPDYHREPFFAVSPDGRRVAFHLRRADPGQNAYCFAMVVMDLAPGAEPHIVDLGGEPILMRIESRGAADFPIGIHLPVTPRWSPDGSWIAFLKRENGSTQIWRAEADGGGSRRLTDDPSDVADFRLSPGGHAIVYATRPALRQARESIEREALAGWHFDDRFFPVSSSRPFPPAPAPLAISFLDLATGRQRAADLGEAALLELPESAPGPRGAQIQIAGHDLLGGALPGALRARRPGEAEARCEAASCVGARAPWWTRDGRAVRFFRREGWARASTAIYEWELATGTVRRLYLTEDVLASCTPEDDRLLCLREGSLQPRRLERLDLATGTRETLFDPNPEFARLQLGRVERLRWRNSFNLETLGDLVLPVGYRPGMRAPLIVVQYDTRGFLRGGTGDEYPIQALAGRGYAVLSLRKPEAIALSRGARDFREGDRINLAGFAERRSSLSAVETGVRIVLARGIADPARIGITGFSNGSTIATSAILHSNLFAAAALSSCCFDTTLAMRAGPRGARENREAGYPGLLDRNDPFWRQVSLAVNARRIRMPILLQMSDNEYGSALEAYTALREAGAPIDLFVFPDEFHVKWQPAHRLAVYRRALDWFDYWLREVRSPDPDRQDELAHWDRLRAEAAATPPEPSGGVQRQ